MPLKPWLRACLAIVHSECEPAPRSAASPYRWRLLLAPPTALLQARERKPLVTRSGASPRACLMASSFHIVRRALDLAVAALTAPPDQSELQLFSSE